MKKGRKNENGFDYGNHQRNRKSLCGKKFADEGYDLILVARNEQKLKQQQAALQETYHVAVRYIVQDLTQESAAGLIMADIDKWKVTIDVLVNNAGFNECGFLWIPDLTGNLK